MSVDADRLVNLCISFHDLWSLPAQIAIALWLLYTQARSLCVCGGAPCMRLVACCGKRWRGASMQRAGGAVVQSSTQA